jgi:hypothetical protein
MSEPKRYAMVWEYCLPVISRTRKGELLFSGSPVPLEQPATTRAVASMAIAAPPRSDAKRALRRGVSLFETGLMLQFIMIFIP